MLLFSTMTKLLDLLEEYVTWRRVPDPAGSGRLVPLEHLRIDGGTSLDGRCVRGALSAHAHASVGAAP